MQLDERRSSLVVGHADLVIHFHHGTLVFAVYKSTPPFLVDLSCVCCELIIHSLFHLRFFFLFVKFPLVVVGGAVNCCGLAALSFCAGARVNPIRNELLVQLGQRSAFEVRRRLRAIVKTRIRVPEIGEEEQEKEKEEQVEGQEQRQRAGH